MAEPKIYSKNYVSSDCAIVSSHSGVTTANLIDRDVNTVCVTTGANSDATTATLEIDFYEGAIAATRTISMIALLNHNLKNWTLYYWDGDEWITATSATGETTTNTVKDFTPVTTNKIMMYWSTTISANAEKSVGELIIANIQLDIGKDPNSLQPHYRQKVKELQLADGSIHQQIIRHSTYRLSKYECDVRFQYLSQATVDSLKAIKELGDPFLWQPESVSRPDQIYYVFWSSPWADPYASTYKTAGYDLRFTLKEV